MLESRLVSCQYGECRWLLRRVWLLAVASIRALEIVSRLAVEGLTVIYWLRHRFVYTMSHSWRHKAITNDRYRLLTRHRLLCDQIIDKTLVATCLDLDFVVFRVAVRRYTWSHGCGASPAGTCIWEGISKAGC